MTTRKLSRMPSHGTITNPRRTSRRRSPSYSTHRPGRRAGRPSATQGAGLHGDRKDHPHQQRRDQGHGQRVDEMGGHVRAKGDPRADQPLDHEQVDVPQQAQQRDRPGHRQCQQELDDAEAEDRVLQARHEEPAGDQAAHGEPEDETREHAGEGVRRRFRARRPESASRALPAPGHRILRRKIAHQDGERGCRL